MDVFPLSKDRIARLAASERERFAAERPGSRRLAERAQAHWPGGVPMHWMRDWGTPFPLVVTEARGAELTDADGHRYADFCLGDTGAMFGHAPPAVVAALHAQVERGMTAMLPSVNVVAVGDLLAQRFGLPLWQVTQSATDANRHVLKWARAITGRHVVVVFDGCYHGAVDDALVATEKGRTVARAGLVGQVVDFASHSRVVDFNDAVALERALAPGDVACVLAEPIMTNAGMVLAAPGFLAGLRQLTRRHGTLLVIDETHTLSSGPGGHAREVGLEPDLLVVGKAIAGGFPCAVYGFTAEVAADIERVVASTPSGHSGMGTTLAGNPLALAALRACLAEVMTDAAYEHMQAMANRLRAGLELLIRRRELPWHVVGVGARTELGFGARPALTAREALEAAHPDLEHALHLYLLNRGVLLTPFHNMMLTSPATTAPHVDALLTALDAALGKLTG
jgi:glutamate-1-semialdehyde 2,1-aminomutase